MPNVQSHVASKGRKSAAAKPIPSKVMSQEDKQQADELKLQGMQVEGAQTNVQSDLPQEVLDQERREREERRAITPVQVANFVAQTLTAPTVAEGADPLHRTPEQLAAEFKQKMDEAAANLAKEMGIQDPTALSALLKGQAPQPPKMQKQARNGITHPGPNTTTGSIWDAADEISMTHPGHSAATIAELKAHPKMRGVNDHTLKTQYARWRKFHDVKGRVTMPVVAQQAQPPVWSYGTGCYGDLSNPASAEPVVEPTETVDQEAAAPNAE